MMVSMCMESDQQIPWPQVASIGHTFPESFKYIKSE